MALGDEGSTKGRDEVEEDSIGKDAETAGMGGYGGVWKSPRIYKSDPNKDS